MPQIRNRLILLHHSSYITRRMLYKLKEYDHTLQFIFRMTPSEISQFFYIPAKKANLLYKDIHSPQLKAKTNTIKQFNIITKYDKAYPDLLREIPDAPLVLYAIGNNKLMHSQKMISVIGTRKPSSEAFKKLSYVVEPLIDEDFVIVSGLAYGVDSFAHQLTLDKKGKTIAIIGSGFQHIYPKSHLTLCRQIAKEGLLLTEYPPETRPQKYHFPERNRIISGISHGTLVIEAMERSGTLITVDQALDQGREVYAIPGSPLIKQTEGCNKLIQDGAKLVCHANDILEDFQYPIEQL